MTTIPTPDPSKPAEDARKPRSDGEQSRERLLGAALGLFAAQGYARTSTREIAKAAGANVAAISYYFGDKAGLYRATFGAMCSGPQTNVPLFEQPHFTLRDALSGYYQQMLGPLHEGEHAEQLLRLWYREMLEPTGLWAEEIEQGIRPEHEALVRVLCRHLGLAAPTDDVQRLAYAIAALAVQIMMGRDIVKAITPQLLATPGSIDQWAVHLIGYAEAMVAAEYQKLHKGKA
ncbi:CerR family C-terminal domain-containing protein [Oxalobacteraceae bacterium]|nr:CerR family C-terminal domain-containing protein [Oxalobacteraceae bacterium]